MTTFRQQESTHSFLAFSLLILASAAQAAPIKVGVYERALGGKAVCKALQGREELTANTFSTFTTEEVLKYDVVFVGATSVDQSPQIAALRTLLSCGGGVVLNHNSCGRRRPETLFPAVVKRVVTRREDTVMLVKDVGHPMTAELPKKFEHAYFDHMFLEPGPDGHVLLSDREGSPVVVVGSVDKGRIVFNGCLPGYWYDPADFRQFEQAPVGGELALVVAALHWAGAGRPTALPADELAGRRQKSELARKMADVDKLLPKSDWFGQEMLQGTYLPTRPVTELGGRYFITYDRQTWRGYAMRKALSEDKLEFYRNRTRIDVHRLKWLGVTDIILWVDVGGENVAHNTEVPDCAKRYRTVDPLAELIRCATPEGLNVWAAWHSCFKYEKFARKYCAKDAEGKYYKYGGKKFCEDLLSPVFRERCYAFLDEYARKYKPMGNFKGLACYDELWFCYADFHGDDVPAFDAFCRERFAEGLPPDIGERLGRQRGWSEAGDVWRRRYMLFKQKVMTDFWRDLVAHAHQRGLQIGVQLTATAGLSAGWAFGLDNVANARLDADFFNTSCSETPAASYRNTYRWAHLYAGWGVYNTHCLRGGPGGICFTFNQFWRPIMYGNNPALTREFARHVHIQRQWAGAEPLPRVGVLHSDNNLQMLFDDSRPQVNRNRKLFKTIQSRQDADAIYTRATERYGQYRLLVATPYAVQGLSEENAAALRAFAEAGGTVVSINADWIVSRPDLTGGRNVTAEFAGITYGEAAPAVALAFTSEDRTVTLLPDTPRRTVKVSEGTTTLVTFADGTPAITEKKLGKGRVIGLHFDAGAELETNDNRELVSWLCSLLAGITQPAVYAEGDGFQLVSAVKKGNWIAAALSPERVPVELQLHIDPKALGIAKGKFRMLMLGKRMEITRPGDLWGESGFWTAAELKAGFRVTIGVDNDRTMPLPEKFDLTAFQVEGKSSAAKRKRGWGEYLNNVTRSLWDSENKGKRKRTYAHEIVVIAPADEPVMPAK